MKLTCNVGYQHDGEYTDKEAIKEMKMQLFLKLKKKKKISLTILVLLLSKKQCFWQERKVDP